MQSVRRALAGSLSLASILAACNGADVSSGPANPPAQGITIQVFPPSIDLIASPGSRDSESAKAVVHHGSVLDTVAVVQWVVDAPSVATVTPSGVVTAVSAGKTVLRARLGGAEGTAALTVTAPSPLVVAGLMVTAHIQHTATLLPDGKVLVAGGGTASAELFDPSTGLFTLTGRMMRPRTGHSATLMPNGKVLIAGGETDPNNYPASGTAELYDPATGTFSPTGVMLQAQWSNSATLLPNGKVLITGGTTGLTSCCRIAAVPELYDPSTGSFTAAGAYAILGAVAETNGLVAVSATALRDGRVLIASEPAAEIYDPVMNTFSRTGTMTTGGPLGTPQYIGGRTGTLLRDSRVLLVGGEHEDFGRFATAELYDASTGVFTATGSMAFVRDSHAATLLDDGRVLITGGEGVIGCDSGPGPACVVESMASAEIYDPSTGRFTLAGTMTSAREFHMATLLKDGRVLITGGIFFHGGPNSSVTPVLAAELYALGRDVQITILKSRGRTGKISRAIR
jgi:hypothetical protein